jgi:hypothetical protein
VQSHLFFQHPVEEPIRAGGIGDGDMHRRVCLPEPIPRSFLPSLHQDSQIIDRIIRGTEGGKFSGLGLDRHSQVEETGQLVSHP